MRKLITFFSIISLLSSSVTTITACSIPVGDQVKINIGNEPTIQKINEDPLRDYVYNKRYYYNNGHQGAIENALGQIMQLALDKIRDNNFKNSSEILLSPDWKSFYKSEGYLLGHYNDINYNYNKSTNLSTSLLTRPFTTTDNEGALLVSGLTDDDASQDQYYAYWFVTSDKPTVAENPTTDARTSIELPDISDFKDSKDKITKEGWIHLFLTINDNDKSNAEIYRIDFNVRINFNFILHVDKNGYQIVVVDSSTFTNPIGEVDFEHPERTYDKYNGVPARINNMRISKL